MIFDYKEVKGILGELAPEQVMVMPGELIRVFLGKTLIAAQTNTTDRKQYYNIPENMHFWVMANRSLECSAKDVMLRSKT